MSRAQLRRIEAALHTYRMQFAKFPGAQLPAYCQWQEQRQEVRRYAGELLRAWHDPALPGAGYDPRNSDRGRWLHLASQGAP